MSKKEVYVQQSIINAVVMVSMSMIKIFTMLIDLSERVSAELNYICYHVCHLLAVWQLLTRTDKS